MNRLLQREGAANAPSLYCLFLAFMRSSSLCLGLRCYKRGIVSPCLRFERRVLHFVRTNPYAVEARARLGIPSVVDGEFEHDFLPVSTRFITGLRRLVRQNYFSGGDFFRYVPVSRPLRFFVRQSEGKPVHSGLCYARSGWKS